MSRVQRRTLSKITVAASAVLVLAIATACGSSGQNSNNGTAAGGPGGANCSGPTAVKVATILPVAGGSDAADGAKARLDDANRNHELPCGRTIDYLGITDSQGTPQGAAAAYRKVKGQDGAFAVVGSVNPMEPTDYVNQQKLPVVTYGLNDSFCSHGANDSWYLYSVLGCNNATNGIYSGNNYGEPAKKLVGDPTGKTVACFSQDYPGGAKNLDNICASMSAAGFTVKVRDVSLAAPPAVISEYSPYINEIMTGNGGKPVDVVVLATDTPATTGFTQAAQRAGFSGVLLNGGAIAASLVAQDKGLTVLSPWATPVAASTNPQMTTITNSLGAAGIPQNKISAYQLIGWYSADMFVKILSKVGANLSPENFAKTASTFNYDVPDSVGPTTYPQAFAAGTPCGELVQSDGTKWNVVAPYACYNTLDLRTQKFIPYSSVDGSAKY